MSVPNWLKEYILKVADYPDKAVLLKEGSQNDLIFILLSGQVRIRKKIGAGWLNLATLKAGSIIGEMKLVSPARQVRTASVVADGPVKVGLLDTAAVLQELELIPSELQGWLRSALISLKRVNESLSLLANEDL